MNTLFSTLPSPTVDAMEEQEVIQFERKASDVVPAAQFEGLLTSREAAPYLRIHYKTLERGTRRGLLPAIKSGKCWLFRLSALSAWVDMKSRSNLKQKSRRPGEAAE